MKPIKIQRASVIRISLALIVAAGEIVGSNIYVDYRDSHLARTTLQSVSVAQSARIVRTR